jgi:hypothetical protein
MTSTMSAVVLFGRRTLSESGTFRISKLAVASGLAEWSLKNARLVSVVAFFSDRDPGLRYLGTYL